MAEKSLKISSLNIFEVNLHVCCSASLVLDSEWLFLLPAPVSLDQRAKLFQGMHVHKAFHRQIHKFSPRAAGWLGESQLQNRCSADLRGTFLSLKWWAGTRAALWCQAFWFTLSSPLPGSLRGWDKCLSATQTPPKCKSKKQEATYIVQEIIFFQLLQICIDQMNLIFWLKIAFTPHFMVQCGSWIQNYFNAQIYTKYAAPFWYLVYFQVGPSITSKLSIL